MLLSRYITSARIHLQQFLRHYWIELFWTRPDNLWALKVTVAIALMVVPTALIGQSFVGCTLALGSVGAALAETDDHPLGRLRSLPLTILCMAIVSLAVEGLRLHPLWFGLCLGSATFLLVLLGGLSTRYQGITFGALLVFVYAMLGAGIKPWYYQPILLPLGGLTYGTISLLLLTLRPYRLLKEQLKKSYGHLADYMELKAQLFPCTPDQYRAVRGKLAAKNVDVGRSIDTTKDVIYACLEVLVPRHNLNTLAPLFRQWMLLQQLHERAASSHQRYDVLTRQCKDKLLVEGFGQFLHRLAVALRKYGNTIITGEKYQQDAALSWTRQVVKRQLALAGNDPEIDTLRLLYNNLTHISDLLLHPTFAENGADIPVEQLSFRPAPLLTRLKGLISASHPRFRHAVRVTICMVVAYTLVEIFAMNKGTWVVLTVLFVCQNSYVATRQRFNQRVAGTLAGVAIGVCAAQLLPTTEGQIILLLGSIYTFFFWLRKRYVYAVIFITMFVIAAFNLQTGTGIDVMEYRIIDTLLGSLLSFLAVRFLWPDWQYRHIPQLFPQALAKTRRYLDTICSSDLRGTVYYHNRRTAHMADNALATAWRGMVNEPKKKRFMQRKTYAMTYLNHALLSYVSALGAHNYNRRLEAEEQRRCNRVATLLEAAERGEKIGEALQEANALCEEIVATRPSHNQVILLNIAKTTKEILKLLDNKQ